MKTERRNIMGREEENCAETLRAVELATTDITKLLCDVLEYFAAEPSNRYYREYELVKKVRAALKIRVG